MQELNVPWQVVVADDFSTDGTREILKEYETKYPDRLRLILQKKNVGPEKNWHDLLKYPTSKYMLYTEGDDYFTDVHKLQKQIDFLEANPEYSLCFHRVNVMFEDASHDDYVHPSGTNTADFTLNELLNQNYIQTNSAMYRRQDYAELPKGIIPGDWYLHLLHARNGKIGFLLDVMSVYRRHTGGAWWGAVDKRVAFWKKYAAGHLELYRAIYTLFDGQSYDATIDGSLSRTIDVFIELETTEPQILQTLISDFPDLLVRYLRYRMSIVQLHQSDIEKREKHIAELYGVIADYRSHINKLEATLVTFHNSLPHKIRRKASHAVRRIVKR
jgi:glycosyltransferase involved in cell wall biosynthesis